MEPKVIKFDDGRWYKDQVNPDGEPHGWGRMTYPDGRRFVGMFRCGRPRGWGVVTWPDGTRYVGDVNPDGEPHGYGVLTDPDENIREGYFRDGILVAGPGSG